MGSLIEDSNCVDNYWSKLKNVKEISLASTISAVGGASAVVGTKLAISLAGFKATGVAVGSLAAATQSVVYGSATTGAFSVLQSVGVLGLGTAAVPIFVTGSTIAGGGYLVYRYAQSKL